MNEGATYLLDVIKKRRTSRAYRPGAVSPEAIDIDTMLEAVRWAPSAANTQPWELVLIDDEKIQRELRDAYLEESLLHDAHYQAVSRKQADLITAPLLIAVCGNVESKESYVDASEIPTEGQEDLFLMSMGAAIQNLLLVATSMGLGSTWIARLARVPQVREILHIPEGLRIVSFVALGIAADEVRFTESLRIPIREKTFHNHYGTMALDRQRKEHS